MEETDINIQCFAKENEEECYLYIAAVCSINRNKSESASILMSLLEFIEIIDKVKTIKSIGAWSINQSSKTILTNVGFVESSIIDGYPFYILEEKSIKVSLKNISLLKKKLFSFIPQSTNEERKALNKDKKTLC